MTTVLAIIGAIWLVWFMARGLSRFSKTLQADIQQKKEGDLIDSDLRRIYAGEAPIHHSLEWYERRLQGRQ